MADFATAGSGFVATDCGPDHETLALDQFKVINEGTFGNATAPTLDQFRALSRGPTVVNKTLAEALESTRLTTMKVIEIIDPLKDLVKEHVVSSACCPVWVMQATLGKAIKKSVLAAARIVAARLCAQDGRTTVHAQDMEDLRAHAQREEVITDRSFRAKMAQVAGAAGKPEDLKRAGQELEGLAGSLKRVKETHNGAPTFYGAPPSYDDAPPPVPPPAPTPPPAPAPTPPPAPASPPIIEIGDDDDDPAPSPPDAGAPPPSPPPPGDDDDDDDEDDDDAPPAAPPAPPAAPAPAPPGFDRHFPSGIPRWGRLIPGSNIFSCKKGKHRVPPRLDVFRKNIEDSVEDVPYVWKKSRKCRVCKVFPLYYMTFPETPGYEEGSRWVCACEGDYCPSL